MRRCRGFVSALLGLVLTLALSGCTNPFAPRTASTRGVSDPPPYPSTPRNALLLFQWCWENRNIDSYRELFTDDFRFAFALTDSSGNAYLQRGWTRDDELLSTQHLFVTGGPGQASASQIVLEFDATLVTLPDSRPGKTDPWHKEIVTRVDLSVSTTDGGGWRSSGSSRFYFVRGDSALIPRELRDRGFTADPNRWYIERYEEEVPNAWTSPGIEGIGAAPAARGARRRDVAAGLEGAAYDPPWETVSWGRLKHLYRGR